MEEVLHFVVFDIYEGFDAFDWYGFSYKEVNFIVIFMQYRKTGGPVVVECRRRGFMIEVKVAVDVAVAISVLHGSGSE